MIETHDVAVMVTREDDNCDDRTSHFYLFSHLFSPPFINRYKFVCIHYYITIRYNDDSKATPCHAMPQSQSEREPAASQHTRFDFGLLVRYNMTKEDSDDDDDDDEARVSFIYHFNIYLSSSSSSSLRMERTKRRTTQNNKHKNQKRKIRRRRRKSH